MSRKKVQPAVDVWCKRLALVLKSRRFPLRITCIRYMNSSILRALKAATLVTAAVATLSTFGYAQAAKKPKVALVMKSLANEFFQTMEKGARDYQAQHS